MIDVFVSSVAMLNFVIDLHMQLTELMQCRFIDETQFEARSPLRVSLERFRERHVRPAVLSQLRVNQQIKLIFRGKVLDPQRTLAELGLKVHL